uniref:killer cell lectin-like receptor subfamily I member 1 isoform X2 n=1 Tax=Myodes glareolus TaxID=447135 RepID=UPI0020206B06|nr:killer cell lectin-like receptor subfamily I member 1 isoform X2 [Myodes glareolus]
MQCYSSSELNSVRVLFQSQDSLKSIQTRVSHSRDTPVEGQQAAKTEVKQNKMPHSKHHEYTANKPDISYTEIKTTKSTQKQRKPKAKQSSVMLSEEQLNYAEMTFHRTPQLLSPKRVVRKKRQGPKTTVWKIVTGILGVLCVVLMTTVGILLPKLFSSQEQSRENLLLDPLLPKEEDGACYLCSLDWIAFGNNFYHSFREIKSWADSQSSCEEWNSHLVEIDSKAELENLLLFEIQGWIILNIDEKDESWLCENGTKIQQTIINDSEKKNHSCYYLNGKQFYLGDCSSKKAYTCEFNKPS